MRSRTCKRAHNHPHTHTPQSSPQISHTHTHNTSIPRQSREYTEIRSLPSAFEYYPQVEHEATALMREGKIAEAVAYLRGLRQLCVLCACERGVGWGG